MYILGIICKSYLLLTKHERGKLFFLVLFFLFSALIQVLGVASIAPFMALLTSPDIIFSNKFYLTLYNFFNFTEKVLFIEAVAVCSLLMMILSNGIGILTLWLSMRFSIVIGNALQCRLYEKLMFRPFLYHKTVNHTESIVIINSHAPRFVYMVLQPLLLLISNVFIGAVILIGLLIVNPATAVIVGFVFSLAYIGTYIYVKKILKKHGNFLTEQNIRAQKILTEGFVGIKDVILNKLHNVFIENFRCVNLKGLHSSSVLTLISDIPKFVVETVAFSVIFIAAIIALRFGSDSKSVVTLLSIYAIAGYRLLPTLQQVYKSFSSLSAHGTVLDILAEQLNADVKTHDYRTISQIEAVHRIDLEKITFKYPAAVDITLSDISVSFELGKINTIAGHSGSGKTTLVDILLGLIPPEKGNIFINGQIAEMDTMMRVQKSCGYVSQHIFILDDTVIANVAFGVDKNDLDISRLNDALKDANAWDFVQKLPDGINTKLGEDGKVLSGGQRQRIGIARSLYKNPKILVLDEPTSALDIESEYEFMMLLRALKEQVLIIIISHRPSAIKCSDLLTLIVDGRVEAHGSLTQLQETSAYFRCMLEKINISESENC